MRSIMITSAPSTASSSLCTTRTPIFSIAAGIRVGGETFFGDLERDTRPRRRFHEEIDDELPAERRHFFHRPLADLFEPFGRIENQLDLVRKQRFDAEEVFGFQRRSGGAHVVRRSV